MVRFGSPVRLFVLFASLAVALTVPVRSFAQAPTFNTLVTTYTNASFNSPNGATAGDFNGDSKLDVFVPDNGAIRMMLGNGNGSFTERDLGIQGGGNIRAADLNGDGRLDAVFVRPQGDLKPVVLLNTGNDANGVPQFSATSYTAASSGLRSVTVGDLNGDGKPDFIVGNAYGSLWVYLNNGNGTFAAGPAYSLTPNAGGASVGPGVIADFSGDGKADYVVTSNQNSGANLLIGNGDGTFQAPVFISNTSDSFAIATADLNGDGKPDFVVGNVSGTVGVFLNSGGGTFSGPTTYSTVAGGWAYSVAIADMNGDGKLDVVASNFNSNSGTNGVAVLLGNGDGTLGSATTYTANQRPFQVSTGDFNGDGKPDIETAAYDSKDVGVLLNTTVFTAPLPTQTLTILGGSGNLGDIAANVEYYNPSTGSWQSAYLTGWHQWGFVAGTNSWINYKPSSASDLGAGPTIANTLWYLYRVRFTVPADAINAKMTFSLKADNLALVAINGANTGPTIAGTADLLNADAVFSQNVHPGENAITLNVGDYGGLNGFNFRIDLSVQSSQPLVIVPVAPVDTTPPVIIAPGSIAREATGPNGAVVAFSATATDNVDATVSVSATPASGSTFPVGVTHVNLSATDAAGNSSSATFTVTVRDTIAPAVTAPGNVTAEATTPYGALVTFANATANDIVGVTFGPNCFPSSGSTFALGTTTVSCSATDAKGNIGSATFTVTVQDTTAPALTLPASQVLEATSAAGAVATFAASATDAVGVTSLTYSKASGSTFAIGTTSVTVTATDDAGKSSSASFTITVLDRTVPVITSLSTNAPTLWPPNHKMVAVTVTASTADLVGVTSLKILSATSSEPDNGLGDGDTAGDIAITGDMTLNLRAERSGKGNGRTYTITVEARDAAGNASTKTCTVFVPKSQGK